MRVLLALEWYDHRIHRGVARVAARRGWHLSCHLGQPGDDPVPPGWRGDGAVSLIGDPARWRRLRRASRYIVDLGLEGPPAPRVVVDNAAIARLAAEHLLVRGYRHLAVLSGGPTRMFAERVAAFAACCHHRVAELERPPATLRWDRRLRELGRRLAALPRPLAVFAVQDSLGAEAVLAAQEVGLAVPHDVAVVGVDDVELLCTTLTVPLASVDSDQEGLGEAAAERLARLLAGQPDDGGLVRWPPRGLTVRASAEALGTTHAGLRRALEAARRTPGLSVSELARRAGLSPQGLDKRCRAELGRTPGALLRELRLAHARARLAAGDSLAQTATAIGLGSASSLCALFRRLGLATPARLRLARD